MKNFPSEMADKYMLRFDQPGLRDRIKEIAVQEHRTLNGQLLHLLKLGLQHAQAQEHRQ